MALPWRRVMNIAYAILTDGWTMAMREEFDAELGTTADKAKRRDEEQDRSARQTAATLGTNVDDMVERAWQARQRALAEIGAKQ